MLEFRTTPNDRQRPGGRPGVTRSRFWFANEAALREIKRVTRPPHRLALLWNDRDHTVPWVRAFDAIIEPHAGSAPRYRSGEWQRALADVGMAAGPRRSFPNPHPATPDQVVDRGLSTSFIAALPPRQREAVRDALLDLAGGLPRELVFPYTTDLYIVELGDLA